jgi:hypothetical protein
MPQICDMGQTALLPLRRKACCGFFHPKNPAGFEPAILGTRGQHANHYTTEAAVTTCNLVCRLLWRMACWAERLATSWRMGSGVRRGNCSEGLYCTYVHKRLYGGGDYINHLTPELNPSTQRCLTRFLLGILLLEPCISLIMCEKLTNSTIIYSVY